MLMGKFFRTPDGRLRGLLVGACCYTFNAVLSMIGDIRNPLSWIPWFLMAVGFFALSWVSETPHTQRSKWRTPAYLLGLAACILATVAFFYGLSPNRKQAIGATRAEKTANPDKLIGTAMDAIHAFHAELSRGQYADSCKN